ncbi:GntR family transcriptional regulator [Streptomyces gardneri]|uniref:GntR family transcriptional regulator n=1 Tax=Nocardia sputi TaxID=2943705 RepID=UPI0018956D6C|nr:GntR family transcriptional regulator [Nocardia sputi]MBF6163853.1 GntR family transcriptional regulator [Streptomyces gardneri]
MAEIHDVYPKYLRISAYLLGLIESGELAPGAEVPSERELAARWKVARPTAAKALNVLRRQGIVETRRGSGTYVAERGVLMRESAPRYGSSALAGESVTVLRAEVVEGPREVTDSLGVPARSRVIVRTTLRESASAGTRLITCWFPGGFAEPATLLLGSDPLPCEVRRYLESAVGRVTAVVRESVGARLATEDERRHLALPHPAAVLVVRRVGLDAGRVALEYREITHPPGQWCAQEYFTSSAANFRR